MALLPRSRAARSRSAAEHIADVAGEKTDTRRQADLVRLMAGYANPMLGMPDATL